MSPTRPFVIAALLGATSLLRAEEVATETTPVDSPAEISAPSDVPDPSAKAPLPGDLPASPAPTRNAVSRVVRGHSMPNQAWRTTTPMAARCA